MSLTPAEAGPPPPERDARHRAVSPGTSDDVVVRLEQVTRVYRQDSLAVHALDGIDLEIQRGDFAVFVGPSGSGKTTLLNLIGGLDSPTAGRIWIAGTETGRMSKAELSEMRLRKIGFVFQEFNLIPVLSALENVEFVMQLQGVTEARRRARDTLTLSAELYRDGSGAGSTTAYDFLALASGARQTLARRYLGVHAGYEITPLLKLNTEFVVNLDDRSRFFAPGITYSIRTNLDGSFGLRRFSGATGSEYSRPPSAVYLSLQWFF